MQLGQVIGEGKTPQGYSSLKLFSLSLMTTMNRTDQALIYWTPRSPWSLLELGEPMTFMVARGAEHSVVTQPVAPLTSWQIRVISTTRTLTEKKFSQSRSCEIVGHLIQYEFLCLPESPIPLLGCDISSKLGAIISLAPNQPASLALGFIVPHLTISLRGYIPLTIS